MRERRHIAPRGQKKRERNPVVLIAAEGKNKTERKYFENFKGRDRINIRFTHGNPTDPVKMMETLVKEAEEMELSEAEGDCAYCVIDTDTEMAKQAQIDKACKKENGLIKVITSSPCFEVWFLCHFRSSTKSLTSHEAIEDLKKVCGGRYEKNADIYPQIRDKTDTAIKNAKRLEEYHIGQGKSIHDISSNPSTEVYKVVQYLLHKADKSDGAF